MAPLVRRRLRLRVPVVSALAFQAPAALALATPRTRLRDAGIYALQMRTYYAHYDMPDDAPDALLKRLHVEYPIRGDCLIGRGECPTTRLQRPLGRPGRLRPPGSARSVAHWSWFHVPPGSRAYILLRPPGPFPRAPCRAAACFDLGLVGYWSVPTAPPWWAGEN